MEELPLKKRKIARKRDPKETSVSGRLYMQFTPLETLFQSPSPLRITTTTEYSQKSTTEYLQKSTTEYPKKSTTEYSQKSTKEYPQKSIQESNLRLGFPICNKIDRSICVPLSVPRYWDTQRNVTTLSTKNVAVTFINTGQRFDEPKSLITSDLFASNGEKFSSVFMSSGYINKNPYPYRTKAFIETATVEGFKISFDRNRPQIRADEFIFPKDSLIIRHPVLKYVKRSPVYCIFPVEKELEDGQKERRIERAVLLRLGQSIAVVAESEFSNTNEAKSTHKIDEL